MVNPRYGRGGRPYTRLLQWVKDNFDDCYRCGMPVDKSLPGTHPWGPSLEHKIPISRGGERLSKDNAALSHLRCNCAYRDGRAITVRVPPRPRYTPSRAW